ncbi:MAG: hypothetical protein E3K32_10555 [wastewater metagenome]|nr:hypothetical protein [Candidatus Brocadia sp.]MCF6158986.1 hypothetical protein [Candidatus Loosdrechtia aerotolerans]
MPGTSGVVVPNDICHITQRGDARQNIFQDDADRLRYLSRIDEYSKTYNLSLFAYCLIGNHVHFIATPRKEASLARGKAEETKHK